MKSINILSIDGGGIRGMIPAEILVYIEEKLSELYNKNIRLSEHFDYITGTSTGGILASLYCFPDSNGKSKYSTKDALELYMNYGSFIFKKQLRWYLTLNGLLGPRYNVCNIENIFKSYFGDIRIKESTTNLMISSIDTTQRDIYFFKSYKGKSNENHNLMFRDVVRSTCAAPTYFKPNNIVIDGINRSLIDGGVGINNPTVSAYIEAVKLFPNAKNINVLSIGTAPVERSYKYEVAKKWGVINGAPKIFSISLDSMSDAVNYQMSKLYENENMIGSYLRIQPQLFGADGSMDCATEKNLIKLKEAGKKSVELYKDKIDNFLQKTLI